MTEAGRVYGGRSESERRADRRARLLAAGLELFGTEGWAGTTIERLCASAGVATRSFYEEFPSREALLLSVFESVLSGIATDIVPQVAAAHGHPGEQIRRGVRGYVDYLTSDPRRARVVHHEIRVAGSLEKQRQAAIVRFADVIVAQARLPQETGRLLGIALVGAVSEVLVYWVNQPEPRPDPLPLVDVLIAMYRAALFPQPA